MDELLKKLGGYLDETVSAEEFEVELNKLSPEDKTKFHESITPEQRTALGKKSEELLGKVSGLRKEKQRLETPPADSFGAQLRNENIETAADIFFKELEIPEAERQHYKDLFKKNDSGHVNVDLIVKDFKRIYAAENSDDLLNIRKDFENFKEGGADFMADNAGAAGGSGDGQGGGGDKKYAPQVHAWVAESKKKGVIISLEEAEKVLNRGLTRRF